MKNLKHQFRTNEQALIQDVLSNGKQGRTWFQIAQMYNIRPEGDIEQRKKSANDVWRRYGKISDRVQIVPLTVGLQSSEIQVENGHVTGIAFPQREIFGPAPTNKLSIDDWKEAIEKIQALKTPNIIKPKRLYYDIETSYNIVKSWRIGFNINLNMEDIIQERAIITIAYKWEGEDEVTVLTWDKGCDKKIIEDFVKVMAEADELVGHNVDRYDTKFIMARALKHNISVLPKYQSTDTLKLAKKHFMLNSNKLDYIAQYLGIGHKTKHRGLEMWDDIILRNDPKAMEEMVEYNVQDVFLTEKVYKKLMEYSVPKVNHSSKQGLDKHNCPQCGSESASLSKTYVSSAGSISRLMSCDSCSTNFTINNTNYKKYYGAVAK